MKIRSRLAENNSREDVLSQVQRLKELSEKNRDYLTYDLHRLLTDPDRFYQSTRSPDEPVWNSNIPPPPVN
jgi:quinol monooxygenase YgiN